MVHSQRDWSSDVCSSDLPKTPKPPWLNIQFKYVFVHQLIEEEFLSSGGIIGVDSSFSLC